MTQAFLLGQKSRVASIATDVQKKLDRLTTSYEASTAALSACLPACPME